VGWGVGAYHVFLDLSPEPRHVLRRPISQCLSKVPPRALAQLALLTTTTTSSSFITITAVAALSKRKRALALDGLLDPPLMLMLMLTPHDDDALPDQRARRARLEPTGKDVPARGARGHLEAQVPWPVDELDDRVRRVVPLPVPVLVHARVPAGALRVARRERREDFGRERGLEQEGRGFLPRRVCAAFAQRDDLARCVACV